MDLLSNGVFAFATWGGQSLTQWPIFDCGFDNNHSCITMCTLGTKLLRMVKLYHYNIYEHNVYRSTMSQTIVILEFVHCKRSDLSYFIIWALRIMNTCCCRFMVVCIIKLSKMHGIVYKLCIIQFVAGLSFNLGFWVAWIGLIPNNV